MMTDIEYAEFGLKAIQDWHDHEGINNANNELLSGLSASLISLDNIPDMPIKDRINCIKTALETAFQIGRANPREATQ